MENKIIITGWDNDADDVVVEMDYDYESNTFGITIGGERTGVHAVHLNTAIIQLTLKEE